MMILPTRTSRITLREAARREQSKALERMARKPDTFDLTRPFNEPCFRCGSAGACRHRQAD